MTEPPPALVTGAAGVFRLFSAVMPAHRRAAAGSPPESRIERGPAMVTRCSGREATGARPDQDPRDEAGMEPVDNTARPGAGRASSSARRINAIHRTSALVLGAGLGVFGILGLINRLAWFSTRGASILGLSSNGLLSLLSLLTAAVLIAAGLRGGRTASTVTVTVGALFLLSGVANVLVLNGPYNILAFRISNVLFSLVVGALLLCLGAWGRFTGRLPPDNPYRRERHPSEGEDGRMLDEQPVDGQGERSAEPPPPAHPATDSADLAELAEAERAAAQGTPNPTQSAGTEAAHTARATSDRLHAWRRHTQQHPADRTDPDRE